MRLHLANPAGINIVRRVEPGRILIGETFHHHSILVPLRGAVIDWPARSPAQLDIGQFTAALAVRPELIVLGTGTALVFPDRRLMVALAERGVGLEVMDTGAACRTFNILVADEREVVGAFML